MHKFSIERLVHFNCFACKGWWSIGDANVLIEYSCPHCGITADCEENTEQINDD